MKYVDTSYDVLLHYDGKTWVAETIGQLNVAEKGETYEEAYDALKATLNLTHAIIARDPNVSYEQYVTNSKKPSLQEANKKWADAWYWDPRSTRSPEKTKCWRTTVENMEWGRGVRLPKNEVDEASE